MTGQGVSIRPLGINEILKVFAEVSSAHELRGTCNRLCRAAVDLFHADHSGLVLFEDNKRIGEVYAEYPGNLGAIGKKIEVAGVPAEEELVNRSKPILIDDVVQSESLGAVRELLIDLGIKSIAVVPIVSSHGLIGSFSLDSIHSLRRFSSEELSMCKLLASLAGVALDNVRHHEAQEKLIARLEALRVSEIAVAAQVRRESLLREILQQAVRLLKVRSGGIYVYYSALELLKIEAEVGSPRPLIGTTLRLGEGLAGRLIASDRSFEIVDDYKTWEHRSPAFAGDDFFGCVLEVVLKYTPKGQPLGVIYVEREQGRFDTSDVTLLQQFAEPAAIALVNSQRLEAAELTEKQLRNLLQATDRIAAADTPSKGLQSLAEMLVEVADASFCHILTTDEIDGYLVLKASGIGKYAGVWESPRYRRTFIESWPGLSERMESGQHEILLAANPDHTEVLNKLSQELTAVHPVSSLLLIPLRSGTRTVGLLMVGDFRPEPDCRFSDTTVDTVLQIARHTTLQIDRVRLYEVEERRRWLLQRLDDAAVEIKGVHVIDALRRDVVNYAVRLATTKDAMRAEGWTIAGLYLNRRALQVLELVEFTGAGELSCGPCNLVRHGDGLIGKTALSRRPLLVLDYSNHPERDQSLDRCRLYAMLALPLKSADGRVDYILFVGHDGKGAIFPETDQEIFNRLAARCAMSFEVARITSGEHRPLQFLNFFRRVSDFLQRAPNLQAIFHAVLTGVTAGYSLGFNRAALLLLDENRSLKGHMGIGHFDREDAERSWAKDNREQLSDAESYFEEVASRRVLPPTPLGKHVGELHFDLHHSTAGAFAVALAKNCCELVKPDRFEDLPSEYLQLLQPETDVAVIPLAVRGQTLGIIVADNKFTKAPVTDAVLEDLQTLANTAAIAIEKYRLRFQKTIQKITQASQYHEVTDAVVEAVRELLNADSGTIWPYDEATDQFIVDKMAAFGFENQDLDEPRKGDFSTYELLRIEYVAVSDIDTFNDERFHPSHEFLAKHKISSFQGVVLTAGSEKVGVLYANYKQRRSFDEEDQLLLKQLAPYAGLVLKKALLQDQVFRVQKATSLFADAMTVKDLDHILEDVASGLKQATECDAVTLYSYNEITRILAYPPKMKDVKYPEKTHGYQKMPEDSIVYRMLNEPERRIVPHVPRDDEFGRRRFAIEEGIESLVVTPLRAGDRKVGVVFVNFRRPHHFSQAELNRIDLFATQAALAIRNAQVAAAQILDSACATARNALGGDFCNIVLPNEQNTLSFVAAEGFPTAIIGQRLPLESHAGFVIKERKPWPVSRYEEEKRFSLFKMSAEFGITSGLGVPMFHGDRIVGAILIQTREQREFTAAEIDILQSLANHTAIAISRPGGFSTARQANERLRAISAVSDALTGLSTSDRLSLFQELLMQAVQNVTDEWGGKAKLATLQEYDADNGQLVFRSVYPPDMYPELVDRLGERRTVSGTEADRPIGLTGRAALTGNPELVSDNVKNDPDYREFSHSTRCEMVVPLVASGTSLAVLNMESDRDGAFNKDDLGTLEAIARVGVLALERLRIGKQLQGLTEVLNNSLLAAGHELLDPLAIIKGRARDILNGDFGPVSEASRQLLQIIVNQANAEIRIASNLCEAVKIHEGKVTLKRVPCNFPDLVRSVTEDFRSVANGQNTVIETDICDGLSLSIDSEKIKLVIKNLLDNALKAVDQPPSEREPGRVMVRVHPCKTWVVCSVEDNGPGIPLAEIAQVFERFYQVGNYSKGMGIGLSISKYFVEDLHRGSIRVDKPLNPTRFSFSLPLR